MNTLVMEPVSKKKVQNKNYSFPEVLSSLQIVFKKPIETLPNSNQPIDLFKNNADFIAYGLDTMTDI